MELSAGLIMPGFSKKAGRFAAFLLVAFASLMLAGCYEVREEVIPAGLGEVIPYAYDHADFNDGGEIFFSRSSFNNDYRFRDVADDGEEKLGTFRVMRIKGNIYVVQARYDNQSAYNILFYAINPEDFHPVEVDSAELAAVAGRHGVQVMEDDFGDFFDGDREKILAMLKGLNEVEFKR